MTYYQDQLADMVTGINNAGRLRVPAFAVIDRIQNYSPGEQVLGAAVALVAMAEAARIDLPRLMSMAHNVMADIEGPFTYHIQAIRDYAKHELTRRGP